MDPRLGPFPGLAPSQNQAPHPRHTPKTGAFLSFNGISHGDSTRGSSGPTLLCRGPGACLACPSCLCCPSNPSVIPEGPLSNPRAGSEKKCWKTILLRSLSAPVQHSSLLAPPKHDVPTQHSWNTPTQSSQTLGNCHSNIPSKIWPSGAFQHNL